MIDFFSLVDWFLANKRSFPWRGTPTPYAVWVSEVMLQQTRAEVVVPYFCKWMKAFPTLSTLAEAKEEEVVKCWEGLGYYSRVRNLHKGAKEVMARYGGKIPSSEKELLSIKGIGPYTAGAILSFAFQKRAPCVDGNVLRVLARLLSIEEQIDQAATQKKMRTYLQEALPQKQAHVVSEALIELGALVCKKVPECSQCPLRTCCQAFLEGKERLLPKKRAGTKAIALYRTVALLEHEGAYLIRKVPKGEVMAGLYEFPYVEMEEPLSCDQRAALLKNRFQVEEFHPFSIESHSFTKYKVTLFPYRGVLKSSLTLLGYEKISLDKLASYPFSSGHKRILHALLQVALP